MMIDSDLIDRARAIPIESVCEWRGVRFGGRGGRVERVGPCPVCGGRDRFSINTRKACFNCRGCGAHGNVIALVMFLDGCDFKTAIERLTGPITARQRPRAIHQAPKKPEADLPSEQAARDLKNAARYVAEMRPIVGTPGEAYLRDIRKIDVAAIGEFREIAFLEADGTWRKIKDVLARTDTIGWHPAVYFNCPEHPLHGQKLGAIVGIMTDPVTAILTGAISRTYLAPDGTKVGKAKTLGAPRGIIRLSPDDEVSEGLIICEGLETALSGMSIGLRPMWATGDCNVMSSLPVLDGIEALTVIADHDENGAGERGGARGRGLLARRRPRGDRVPAGRGRR